MARFTDILTSVEALFVDPLTVDGNTVPVYPTNYVGQINDTEWVRLNVFTFNSELQFSGQFSTGQVVCNIFVPTGMGVRRATAIADALDSMLSRKIISSIQTFNGFIQNVGVDPVNKGLYRIDLITNFTNF